MSICNNFHRYPSHPFSTPFILMPHTLAFFCAFSRNSLQLSCEESLRKAKRKDEKVSPSLRATLNSCTPQSDATAASSAGEATAHYECVLRSVLCVFLCLCFRAVSTFRRSCRVACSKAVWVAVVVAAIWDCQNCIAAAALSALFRRTASFRRGAFRGQLACSPSQMSLHVRPVAAACA